MAEPRALERDAVDLAAAVRSGEVRAADCGAAPPPHRRATRSSTPWPTSTSTARGAAEAVDARSGGRRPRALAGCRGGEGATAVGGMPTPGVEDLRRPDGPRPTARRLARMRRRSRDRGADHGARVRGGELHQHPAARRHPQSLGPVAHAGRVVGRLRGGGGVGDAPRVHGQRRRRLDPHPGELQRPARDEGHLRAHRRRSRRAVRFEPHVGARPDGPLGARRRAVPRRDGRSHRHRPAVRSRRERLLRAGRGERRRRGALRRKRVAWSRRSATPASTPTWSGSPGMPRSCWSSGRAGSWSRRRRPVPRPGSAWGLLSALNMAAFHADDAQGRFDELTPVVRLGFEALGRLDAAGLGKAVRRRQELLDATAAAWEHFDFLLTPTTPTTARPRRARSSARWRGSR